MLKISRLLFLCLPLLLCSCSISHSQLTSQKNQSWSQLNAVAALPFNKIAQPKNEQSNPEEAALKEPLYASNATSPGITFKTRENKNFSSLKIKSMTSRRMPVAGFIKKHVKDEHSHGSVKKIKPLSLTGFILGLMGAVMLLTGLVAPILFFTSVIFSIAAIIVSAISLATFHKDDTKHTGRGFALAGLALGIAVAILWFIIAILIIIALAIFM